MRARTIRRPLALAAVATLALAAGCGGGESAPRGVIAVGAEAPEYAARTIAGDSISLASLRGQVVLLNVWATWCHPCRDEIPELEALHKRHAADGLRVVGVSVDVDGMQSGIHEFMRDFSMTYDVWLDPGELVSARFRTIGVPETVLIDRAGVIRWRKIGPIPAHDADLKAALDRALAG